MTRSRAVALGLVLALSLTSAGCQGLLLGSGSLEFAAEDATVSSGALEETGYQEARDETVVQNQTFTVAGQNRTVTVSSEIHAYNRTGSLADGDEAELGRLVVLSVPAVEVAGQTINPLGGLSNRDLVRQFAGSDSGASLGSLRFERNRSVRSLGDERTVSTFRTDPGPGAGGAGANVSVHVTLFRHGSDFVAAVAVHPSRASDEPERVDALLRSLRHRTEG